MRIEAGRTTGAKVRSVIGSVLLETLDNPTCFPARNIVPSIAFSTEDPARGNDVDRFRGTTDYVVRVN